MALNQILSIPIIEEAAPSDFPARVDRELRPAIQIAIDMLRCPACGSMNYDSRLFVLTSGVLNSVACRGCGNVRDEILDKSSENLLPFLSSGIIEDATSWE